MKKSYEDLRPGFDKLEKALYNEKRLVCIDSKLWSAIQEISRETGKSDSEILGIIIRKHLKSVGKI